ncbi:MAG: hypothetical protein ABSG07_08975 [Terriglobales bacterium]|jgi:hypothetical protein
MNPHTPYKLAGRLLIALTAISSLFFMAACGSSNSLVPPNNNGFTNGNLSGTYVLSISGTDITADTFSFFAIVGTITADGNGNITGGTVDINDPDLGGTGVFLAQTVSANTYNISPDGRGTGTLVTPVATFGLDFVLTSGGHGLITRFDGGGSGSGTLDLQGSATQSSLASLAFSLSGANAGVNPAGDVGTVGAFTLNTSTGLVTTGIQDFNFDNSSAGLTGLPIATTSSLVLTSGTNGTAALTTSGPFGSLAFDVWVIDSTHLKLIETDTSSGLALSGDAFTQQTSFTAGQLAFTVGGADVDGDPVAAGGFVTTDVNGDLSAGLEDYNNAGTPGTVQPFTGNCNTFAGGRCQLALTAFTNGLAVNLEFAAYPSSGGVLLLEDDSAGILQGAAFAQTATSFTVPGDFGLNLSGANPDGEVDDIAQFNATTAVAPSTNMTGLLDENNIGNPTLSDLALSGYYTPDPTADGRGSITVPNIGTNIGTLNLEYYVVDASTVVFIDVDSNANNAPQVAVGTFQVQSSSQSGVKAQSHMAMVHPLVRPHGAFRRK